MSVNLTVVLSGIVKALDSPRVFDAAADAMEEAMVKGVSSTPIGPSLRMSGFRGPPMVFAANYTAGSGLITLPLKGGTYALADKGRYKNPKRSRIKSRQRKRRGKRRPTLSTPYGPRVSVRRSKWVGFHLTDTYGPVAVGKAVEAAAREAIKAFDLAA